MGKRAKSVRADFLGDFKHTTKYNLGEIEEKGKRLDVEDEYHEFDWVRKYTKSAEGDQGKLNDEAPNTKEGDRGAKRKIANR